MELVNIGQVRRMKGAIEKNIIEPTQKIWMLKVLKDTLLNRNGWRRMIHVLDLA